MTAVLSSPAMQTLREALNWDDREQLDTAGTVTLWEPVGADLTPGVVDSEARSYYRHGACQMLAVVIGLRTGWPVLLLRSDEYPFVHVANRHPSGQVLDIVGLSTEEELFAYYADYGVTDPWFAAVPRDGDTYSFRGGPVTRARAAQFFGEDAVLLTDVFAETLLAQVGWSA